MTGYQKFALIAGQVLLGLGFGIVGLIVAAFGTYAIFEVADVRLDLYGEFMYAMIGGYIGMQAGVAFEGFKLLKRNNQQNEFARFLVQSLIGTIAALVISFAFATPSGHLLRPGLINFLMVALPLIGATVGFNIGLDSTMKQREKK